MPTRFVPVDLLYMRSDDAEGGTSNLVPVVCRVSKDSAAVDQIAGRRRAELSEVAAGEGRSIPHSPWWRQMARWLPITPRPTVRYIERDRFLVESGFEQACLAKRRDVRWLHVDMSEDSAQAWDSRSVATLKRDVRETGRRAFYNPVLHPEYRKARTERPDSIRIDRIRRLLGPYGPGYRGLDIGCNIGYTSHMLQRHGVQMTGIDFDQEHLAAAKALDETYRLGTPFLSGRFEQFAARESFDIVVLLTVMYHALDRSEGEAVQMIQHIDDLGPAVLIWESGSYPVREIELVSNHSGLTQYLPLGGTQATGKIRELGAFVRPGTELGERLTQRYESDLAREFRAVSVMATASR